jgi:hypothetical protein
MAPMLVLAGADWAVAPEPCPEAMPAVPAVFAPLSPAASEVVLAGLGLGASNGQYCPELV